MSVTGTRREGAREGRREIRTEGNRNEWKAK